MLLTVMMMLTAENHHDCFFIKAATPTASETRRGQRSGLALFRGSDCFREEKDTTDCAWFCELFSRGFIYSDAGPSRKRMRTCPFHFQ